MTISSNTGLSRAWAIISPMQPLKIVNGYNIAAITESGQNRYTVAFSHPMGNANYSYYGTASRLAHSLSQAFFVHIPGTHKKTDRIFEFAIEDDQCRPMNAGEVTLIFNGD